MGQQIEKRGDFSGLVAGSEQYMTAKFYFDREWAGKVKVAEFRRIDSKIAECFSEKITGIVKEDIPLMAKHAEKEANPLYPVPKLMTRDELEQFYYRIADWSDEND